MRHACALGSVLVYGIRARFRNGQRLFAGLYPLIYGLFIWSRAAGR